MMANPEFQMVRYEKLRYVSIAVHRIVRTTTHEHGVLELGLVLSGQVRVQSDQGTRLAQTGDLLLFNAYEQHSLEAVGAASANVLFVWISGHFAKDYFARINNLLFDSGALETLAADRLMSMRGMLLEAAQSYFREGPGYQLECVGHLDLLLTGLLRSVPYVADTESRTAGRQKNTNRKRRIASYIEQHYKQRLTLSELAQAEGLTTAYMSRLFRELFGMAFQEYLNLQRLECALPLLRDPSVYLVDVCMESGFSDTRYLNSVCTKIFGCSAAQYRSRYAGELPKQDAPAAGSQEHRYDDCESLQLLQPFREKYMT